jgi:transcriptional regulator GlxA family with amidase domain
MRYKRDITRDAALSLLLLRDNSLERRVVKILEMVEAGNTFAIRDLAAQLRLSPAYLQRLFKNETGVRMGEWLSEQRLQRAAYLLSSSYLSIKEITHAIGYEHTSSFIRAFERRFLQAPARYRKQNEGRYETQGAKRIQVA